MNRKTFIGTIAGGITALLNLPQKANAVVAVVTPKPVTGAQILAMMPPPPRMPIDDWFTKEGETRHDPDGKVYRFIKGEWVHVATAMPEGFVNRNRLTTPRL